MRFGSLGPTELLLLLSLLVLVSPLVLVIIYIIYIVGRQGRWQTAPIGFVPAKSQILDQNRVAPVFCSACGKQISELAPFCAECGTPRASGMVPQTGAQAMYAGIGSRWVAHQIIDGIAAIVAAVGVAVIAAIVLELIVPESNSSTFSTSLAESEQREDTIATIVGNVSVIGWFAYYWWGNATGQSLGKKLLGIRIVQDTDGSAPGWGRGLGRTIGYFISSVPFGLGYLWALWDPRKQAWHDKMVGTVVVREWTRPHLASQSSGPASHIPSAPP